MSFSENLKELREGYNLSQAELAKRVGIAQSAIAHYERGVKLPNIITAVDLSNALGTTCEKLVMGENKEG